MANKRKKIYRGDLLHKAFKASGLTWRELPGKTGLSIGTIRAAFAGRPSVQVGNLKALSVFFSVDWVALYTVDQGVKTNERI